MHLNNFERLVGRVPFRSPNLRDFFHFSFSSIKQHCEQTILKNPYH